MNLGTNDSKPHSTSSLSTNGSAMLHVEGNEASMYFGASYGSGFNLNK